MTARREKVAHRTVAEQAVAALNKLPGEDPEREHAFAENILYTFAPNEVREAYEKAQERAGGWWWA